MNDQMVEQAKEALRNKDSNSSSQSYPVQEVDQPEVPPDIGVNSIIVPD